MPLGKEDIAYPLVMSPRLVTNRLQPKLQPGHARNCANANITVFHPFKFLTNSKTSLERSNLTSAITTSDADVEKTNDYPVKFFCYCSLTVRSKKHDDQCTEYKMFCLSNLTLKSILN